jgi:hypothetical protein
MKKFLISGLALIALMFPAVAQEDHDFSLNDRVPVVNTTIPKDQVPALVQKAVAVQFDRSQPLTWSKFPYALKEYGWVYDVGASDLKLDRYEVTMKTQSGNELWAVYSADGEIIESREMSTNIPVPKPVMDKFLKSKYKDWKITGNKEIIKFYHDHDLNASNVEQHFRINVEKDGVKRAISFNWQGKS